MMFCQVAVCVIFVLYSAFEPVLELNPIVIDVARCVVIDRPRPASVYYKENTLMQFNSHQGTIVL